MRRRSWLKLGAGAAVVVVLGGGAAALMSPALRDGKLQPEARAVVAAIGAAVLQGVLPAAGPEREAAVAGLVARVETLVGALPPHARSELTQLLSLLASTPGRITLAGLQSPWQSAAAEDVQAALQAMRMSTLALRQQAYQGLHDLVAAAYFSEPATWSVMGYPGPTAIA